MSEKYDRHFLKTAELHAKLSKDPSTKVGAVIVGTEREGLVWGFNGLPRGLKDTPERLNNSELKNKLVVHAEINAVLVAAKLGIPLKGTTMYIAACNCSGDVWGGPPCHRCLVEIIQAGITEIVTYPFKSVPSKWKESLELSMMIINEVGIKYREVSP